MKWAPSFFSGSWDAIVVPAADFFSVPEIRKEIGLAGILVYGPSHLLRSAWHSGVQDYLREPWLPEELFLRLRGAQPSVVTWTWEGSPFWLVGQTIKTESGTTVQLSRAEADLLRILIQRQGMPVSRSVLAWASGCSEGRVVDTLVSRLRKKLGGLEGMRSAVISSIRGLGYRLP